MDCDDMMRRSRMVEARLRFRWAGSGAGYWNSWILAEFGVAGHMNRSSPWERRILCALFGAAADCHGG